MNEALAETLANTRARLLAARTPAGNWEGELSSSALSTATASFTFWLYANKTNDADARRLSAAGAAWLVAHQNVDGGWGDTTDSVSNISTTCLCWSFLSALNEATSVARAGEWLKRAAGSLEPKQLAKTLTARYGKDHTFSVPILTMAVLAGQLGGDWRLIPSLPFELAIFPQSFFRFLRLPVVSYALPALIAMGQVGHYFRPTRNPFARVLRNLTRGKTLRVLEAIQPPSGGYLEATPLTSFVSMSLIAMGAEKHVVVQSGLRFLTASTRPDGSWPIDTNLATWVTTLSINALPAQTFSDAEKNALRESLLKQQYRVRHPYTGAAPGAWAWTHLSGGVPDSDDTAGALIALDTLGQQDAATIEAAGRGMQWLLDLQNSDGGMPTFCRGWGTLPFDRSAADLTAHALGAWSAWRAKFETKLGRDCNLAIARSLNYLRRNRRADGSWVPLWFGNEFAEEQENPVYGTARVLIGLVRVNLPEVTDELIKQGASYLLLAQNSDGGWGGARGMKSTIEETALAVDALAGIHGFYAHDAELERGTAWLISATKNGTHFPTAPIGLYFAKLWYHERLYPLIFTAAALGKMEAIARGDVSANKQPVARATPRYKFYS